jgi:transcription elongation GreA/GreB family factor/transcription elongation factor GreA-like protein
MQQQTATSLVHLAAERSFDALEEAWMAALEAGAPEPKAFTEALDRLAAQGEYSRAETLSNLLAQDFEAKGRHADLLPVLRRLAAWKRGGAALRTRLTECLRQAHKGRPGLEVFLKLSGMLGTRDPEDALRRLDDFLSLGPGRFVVHEAGWGVGQVVSVDDATGEIVVDFEQEKGHLFPVDGARSFLKILEPDHLIALKYSAMDRLRALAAERPLELLKLAVKARKGKATTGECKNDLAGSVIPADEWTRWWGKARRAALNDPFIEVKGEGAKAQFTLRERPLTYAEETHARIAAAADAAVAARIARAFLKQSHDDTGLKVVRDAGAPRAAEGRERFMEKDPGGLIEALLFLEESGGRDPRESEELRSLVRGFAERARSEGRFRGFLVHLLAGMEINEYRKRLLRIAREDHPVEWVDLYAAMLESGVSDLWDTAVQELRSAGQTPLVTQVFRSICSTNRDKPEAFLILAKDLVEGHYQDLPDLPNRFQLLERMLHLLDGVGRTRATGEAAVAAKRHFGKLREMLVDRRREVVDPAFHATSKDEAAGLLARAAVLAGVFPEVEYLRVAAGRVHPELRKGDEKPFWETPFIFVSRAALERKKVEFDHLINVKIPENSRAIGLAASHGDLSENAEWTAAIEEQGHLTRKAEEMKGELDKARLIEEQDLPPGVVAPGTRVRLVNLALDREESYLILGPWDADPEKGVVPYTAPLALGLLGRTEGTEVEVQLPQGRVGYRLVSLERAF